MTVKPLNNAIGKLVDAFLEDPDYYEKFENIAKKHGVESDNPDVIKMAMFSLKDEQLIFVEDEVETLFTEWQLFAQLTDQEPYASLLRNYPERKPKVMNITKRLLEGDEVTDKEVIALFKGLEDEG